MPQAIGVVTGAFKGVLGAVSDNVRKNEQQKFEQQQAELMAQYERDKQTTLTFDQWALQNQQSVQQFNMANSASNNTQYIVAAAVILVAGFSILYLTKKQN